jgi:hypothetical protein
MTLSFWGFILVSVAALFVYKLIRPADQSLDAKPHLELFADPYDEAFWTFSNKDSLADAWQAEGVRRLWLPVWVDDAPFFRSKSIRYVVDEPPTPLEYVWYQKAVFPQWQEAAVDANIKLGFYLDYRDALVDSSLGIRSIKPKWFHDNGLWNVASDSSRRFIEALAEECLVNYEVDFFMLALPNDTTGKVALGKAINRAFERRNMQRPVLYWHEYDPKYSMLGWEQLKKDEDALQQSSAMLIFSSASHSLIHLFSK